ncbi:MAG: hypothetical protein J1F11_12205 [Oscillospiraceae bacterium]|nr:hypothetical protein [Oscillospiraceae bacterium]
MSTYNLSSIIQLLNPDNTLSAHRMLAHSIGITEAMIYSALISKQVYYSQNNMLYDGEWFYSTISDLQGSTTFGAKAQKTAISNLISHGMIECKYKGMPAKRYFRIIDDTENLMRLIEEGIKISKRISGRSKDKTAERSQQRSYRHEEHNAVPCSNLKAASCSCPEDISCSNPKALSCSHPAENKTKDNKPKENNPEINQSVDPSCETAISQKTEKIDGQNKQPMKFHEVLEAIGVSYSYYFSDDDHNAERPFWETIICCITDMTEKDSVTICGQAVRYHEIIDRLNEIITQHSLADCFSYFEEKWQELLAEKEIVHPKAYLRSCLWNWLCDYDLERSKV